jgi:hypothetical protein
VDLYFGEPLQPARPLRELHYWYMCTKASPTRTHVNQECFSHVADLLCGRIMDSADLGTNNVSVSEASCYARVLLHFNSIDLNSMSVLNDISTILR